MWIMGWLQRWQQRQQHQRRLAAAKEWNDRVAIRTGFTPLEARKVLNAAPVAPPGGEAPEVPAEVVVDAGPAAGDGQADVFHVSRVGDRVQIELNGITVQELEAGQQLKVVGSTDADRVEVDFSGGNPLDLVNIQFEGGGDSGNELVLLNGQVDSVTHELLADGAGAVEVGGGQITYGQGVKTADQLDADERTFDIEGTDEAVTLADHADQGASELSTASGHAVSFATPRSMVTIDTADAASDHDSITVAGLDQDFQGTLNLHGDSADAVTITGALDLQGGDLSALAGSITVSGSVTTDEALIELNGASRVDIQAAARIQNQGGENLIDAGASGLLTMAGVVDAADLTAGATGGTVHLLGKDIALHSSALVNVSGNAGGGTLLVGGDYQGKNADVRNAQRVFIGSEATLKANAIEHGDGGKVIVWADQITRYFGSIEARGGTASGDGGFVETSGKEYLEAVGRVDASATSGSAGTWLLDPRNVTVDRVSDTGGDDSSGGSFDAGTPDIFTPVADDAIADIDAIEASLNGGTSVTITTGSTGTDQAGIITVVDSISKSGGGTTTLTFDAAGGIVINSGVTIESSSGSLNLVLQTADGDIDASGSTFTTNGGSVEFNATTGDVTLGSISTGAPGGLTVNAGGLITNANQASISVVTSELTGSSIDLGNNPVDSVYLGSLAFNATGDVNITNDSTITIVADSSADNLTLSATSVTIADGATLSVAGAIDSPLEIADGGQLSPAGSGTGTITLENTTFNAGSTLNVEVNGGTAGDDYDQLDVTGTVDLGGATLTTNGTITALPGQEIVLINNDDADAVTGTFAALAEGDTVTINGIDFTLSYAGGDGNDVTLTQAPISFSDLGVSNLVMRLNGTDIEFVDPDNGNNVVASYALADMEGNTFEILGTDGATETLTIDYSGGFFEVNINWIGGTAGNHELVVTGGTFETVTHTFTAGDSGNLVYDTGSASATITYTGLEPVDMTGSTITNLILNLPDSDDDVFLEDDGTGSNGISQIRSGSGGFETTTFDNSVSTVTVNMGATASVNLSVNLPDYTNSLEINGSGGTDTVNFTGTTNLSTSGAALTVDVNGAITDDDTTTLTVDGQASFTGSSITLGDNVGDVTEFGSLTFNSTGAVSISEDDDMVITGANTADSLELVAEAGTITDASDADITVTNNASFTANGTGGAITLGDESDNADEFGSVTFNSVGAVDISQDDDMVISGTNTADSAALVAEAGTITDASDADITVTNNASFTASGTGGAITIGNDANNADEFGSVTFNSVGAVAISEDDDMVITGTNTADSLDLVAEAGTITDAADADITVTNNASFTANGTGGAITIGDEADNADEFGSVTFNSVGAVAISEDDDMVITGTSTADSADLVAEAGTITDASDADITVTNNASFTANGTGGAITIGDEADNVDSFGSVTFNSVGAVAISEDDDMVIAGTNTADSADLVAEAGTITDASDADITVTNNASFTGSGTGGAITIGDDANNADEFGSVTFNSVGAVAISEDDDMVIAGTNTAASANLVAEAGTITDADDADITVTNNASFTANGTGGAITIGDEADNVDEFGSVTFNSVGSVAISEDDDMVITGTNTADSADLTSETAAINGSGLVTAVTVDLNAVTGIGDTTALELAATTVTADTTNGNIDLDNALATAMTFSTLTTGTGTITVDASGGGDASFTTVTTDDGAIDLEVVAADLTVGTGVTAGGDGNDVSLTTTTSGDVILTGATTADEDTVTITSAAAINGAGLVTAATVDLNAVTGIGNTTALELAATTVTADTTNGNIDLDNALATAMTFSTLTTGTGSITVDASGGGDATFTTVTTTEGAIDLEVIAADLTVGTAVTAEGDGNDITLTTTTSGDVILTGTTTAAGDTVTITSAAAINGAGLVTADTVELDAVTGIGATTAMELAATTVSADTTDGDIDLDNALATAMTFSTLTTGTGTITVDASGGDAATFTTVTTTAGAIDLEVVAADLTVGTAVTAGGDGNDVSLTTTTSGDVILTGTTTAAGDTVTITSAAAINGSGLVTAATVDLNAGSAGIGSSGTPVNVSATNLETTTTGNGNQFLSEADTVIWDSSSAGTGTITLEGGTFNVGSAETITAATVAVLGSVTLGGSGTVTGAVTVASGGAIVPGNNGTGVLSTGNITFTSGSDFSVNVNGATSGTQHDQLNVTGTVDITGVDLTTAGAIAFSPGQQIVLINNDGSDAITGTFTGLSEGDTVSINGVDFILSYVGGPGGNDVTLTQPGNVTFTSDGMGAGALELRLNGSSIEFVDDGVVVDSRPLAALEGQTITVNGVDGQSETLLINYAFGGFFDVDVDWHGGVSGSDNDALDIDGGTFTTVTHTFTTTGPENSGTIVYETGSATATITYDGLEPVDMAGSTITNLIFNLPDVNDNVFLEDDGTGSNGISQIRSGGGNFETTTFDNSVGTVTVNMGATADVNLTVNLPDFTNSLEINGSGGTDTVTFTGTTNLSTTDAHLTVDVSGAITDDANTTLTVDGNASFTGGSVTLGDNAGDTTGFGTLTFNSVGAVAISEDDDMVITGTNTADSLDLVAEAGTITDAADADITVTNNASFTANGTGGAITIGDEADNADEFGSVTFNSVGAVAISEDDDMVITGANNAASAALVAEAGTITDAADADITVTNNASFTANGTGGAITIGDEANNADEFGSVTFNSVGAVAISEDDDMVITGVNTADSADLVAEAGTITDASDADITVTNNASFTANGTGGAITIGDEANNADEFGSVTFNSVGAVAISEDDDMVIAGTNTADSLDLVAEAGTITDASDADITVTSNASFTANGTGGAITIGDEANNADEFGSVTFNSVGAVAISEDDDMVIAGVNTADSLDLVAEAGTITDAADADITVTNNASFTANGTSGAITIGDEANNADSFGSVTFNSVGAVAISEDDDMVIAGTNTADSADLVAEAGTITDATDADITVTNNASFTANGTGGAITIGDDANNADEFGSVTFNSVGAVAISEDDDMVITGTNTADSLALVAEAGTITDATDADITVTNNASFSANGTGGAITIGDEANNADEFGTLTFNSAGAVYISEDDDMVIANANTADSATLISETGSITDASDADIDVTNNASFTAGTITIGDEVNNADSFGSVTFNSAGAVYISEDDDMVITGANTADSATLISETGSITDASDADIDVTNNASFSAGTIIIGDEVNNADSFGSVTFNSAGAVYISEDDDMVITGANTADSATLISETGSITDASDADIDVTNNASFSAGTIIIGDDDNNADTFGSVTFNSPGNVFISEDDDMVLTDTSTAANATLISEGGSINDDNSMNPAIIATTLELRAIDGVGTQANRLVINVETVAALTTETGGIYLEEIAAGGNLVIGNVGTTDGLSSAGANGDISVLVNDGSLELAGPVTAGTGTVRLRTDGTNHAVTQTSAGPVTASYLGIEATGDVTLCSAENDVDFLAISAPGRSVSFEDVDSFELDTVTAGDLLTADITGITADEIELLTGTDFDVNLALNATTVRLESGGNLTQSATISATSLSAIAGGSITLTNANNDVTIFAAEAGSNISYNDLNSLIIGEVSGGNCVDPLAGVSTTTSGNITITAAGMITISNFVFTTAADDTTVNLSNISISTTAGDILVNATVTADGAGDVTLAAGAQLLVNNVVSSGIGDLVLSGTAVTHDATGDLTTGGAGTISVTASAGNITMADGTVYSAGSGAITMLAGNSVLLGQAQTTGPITVTATTGNISDNTAGEGAGSENLAGGLITLVARTGIGSSSAAGDIDTAATTIAATTATGGIFLTETDAVALGPLSTTTSGNIVVNTGGAVTTNGNITTAGNGNIAITSASGGIITSNQITANGSGTVNVVANGAGSDVALNNNVTSGSGVITVTAADAVALAGNVSTSSTVSILATGGAITRTAGIVSANVVNLSAGANIGSGVITDSVTAQEDNIVWNNVFQPDIQGTTRVHVTAGILNISNASGELPVNGDVWVDVNTFSVADQILISTFSSSGNVVVTSVRTGTGTLQFPSISADGRILLETQSFTEGTVGDGNIQLGALRSEFQESGRAPVNTIAVDAAGTLAKYGNGSGYLIQTVNMLLLQLEPDAEFPGADESFDATTAEGRAGIYTDRLYFQVQSPFPSPTEAVIRTGQTNSIISTYGIQNEFGFNITVNWGDGTVTMTESTSANTQGSQPRSIDHDYDVSASSTFEISLIVAVDPSISLEAGTGDNRIQYEERVLNTTVSVSAVPPPQDLFTRPVETQTTRPLEVVLAATDVAVPPSPRPVPILVEAADLVAPQKDRFLELRRIPEDGSAPVKVALSLDGGQTKVEKLPLDVLQGDRLINLFKTLPDGRYRLVLLRTLGDQVLVERDLLDVILKNGVPVNQVEQQIERLQRTLLQETEDDADADIERQQQSGKDDASAPPAAAA